MLLQNVTIAVYLLCMGGHSLIITDQEDESVDNGKLTAMYVVLALEHRVLFHNSFWR